MGTHGFSKNPYPYPPKTRTRDQGYGFLQVRVRVWAEIPWGYPWQSLVFRAGGGQTKVETPKMSMTLVFGAGGGKGKVETQKTSVTGSSSGLVPGNALHCSKRKTACLGRASPPTRVSSEGGWWLNLGRWREGGGAEHK